MLTSLQRITAVSGALFFLLTVIAIATIARTGLTEQLIESGRVAEVLTITAASLDLVTVAMWLFNASTVSMAVFATGLAGLLERDHPRARVAALLVVLGAAGLLLETTMTIGLARGFAPAYAAASDAERPVLEAGALALIHFRNATALLAFLLVSGAALLFGLVLIRSRSWPSWTGWLPLASGALGLVGGLYPFYAPLSFVRAGAYVVFSLWGLVLGIRMLHWAQFRFIPVRGIKSRASARVGG